MDIETSIFYEIPFGESNSSASSDCYPAFSISTLTVHQRIQANEVAAATKGLTGTPVPSGYG
ncbi:MAG: hypothetical protein ABEI31_04075, partial [Halodesulfurarchaeum sp.]